MKDTEKTAARAEAMQKKLISYMDQINIQFREPATSIFASMPLMVNSINSQNAEKAIEGLENIYQNTYRILRGLNNMSMAAKLMDGYQFKREPIDLSGLVNGVFGSSQMILPSYVSIEKSIEDGCFADGNTSLLTVGLLNILLNSIDYRQEDNVKISVSLKKADGRSVLVYTDNSLGVKDELAGDIFTPLFTANPYNDGEPSTKPGLGLYIAQQAVKQAGGTMLLQTEFAEGVKYIISLPDSIASDTKTLKSYTAELLMNRYSDIFVQLCEHCRLPDLI
ncbi:MAG: HAMP domain-containing histidine kinase [Oscillospiraceae bacterium]|nr:HAMP domain-containing histidine kinase [Oscillospiraceae bacterium]